LHAVDPYSAIELLCVAQSTVGRYTEEVAPCIAQLQTFVSDSNSTLWRDAEFVQVQEVQFFTPEQRQGCAQFGLQAAQAASVLAEHNIVNSWEQHRNRLSPFIFCLSG
jgi:hypothetical protein